MRALDCGVPLGRERVNAMSNHRPLHLVATLLAVLLCGVAAVAAQTAPERAAQQALDTWLPLWDAGKYDESYDRLAERTKRDISRAQWIEYGTAVRKPLGLLKSRALAQAQYIKELPALPGQDGAMLQYDSSFADREHATETFGMVQEKDGAWRVANYLVK